MEVENFVSSPPERSYQFVLPPAGYASLAVAFILNQRSHIKTYEIKVFLQVKSDSFKSIFSDTLKLESLIAKKGVLGKY